MASKASLFEEVEMSMSRRIRVRFLAGSVTRASLDGRKTSVLAVERSLWASQPVGKSLATFLWSKYGQGCAGKKSFLLSGVHNRPVVKPLVLFSSCGTGQNCTGDKVSHVSGTPEGLV